MKQNKYFQLCRQINDLQSELHQWKRQCTTVKLYSFTDDFELRMIQDFFNFEFPELVSNQCISDGGKSGVTLVAPIEDVKVALELVIESHQRIKDKYGERIQYIIDNCKVQETMELKIGFR